MADNTPTPRSYNGILGDIIDAFLSRTGLPSIKVGNPILSAFEAAAQSDLRSSEDTFTLLDAVGLDQANGVALDRIGFDEGLFRQPASPASGPISITDISFSKISTKLFQGTPAPIVGSQAVNVADANDFPSTGSIYIGRSTPNYEGPIAYTSKKAPGTGMGQSGGNYWTLVLSTGTLRFHNLGESIVLAQGGTRQINAGTIVQTPQGNSASSIQFKTLYTATIPDGEVSVDGVTVVALRPGVIGNVIAGAISSLPTSPFTGAVIANPSPLTNGLASETDDSFRERIRQVRRSRTKGTATAIETFAVGVTTSDENKRVLSASVVSRQGSPSVLYIDDGTGYEEQTAGVAIETFTDQAFAGDNYFKVSQRPVAKALVTTTNSAPYVLASGEELAVKVGGTLSTHTFDSSSFRAIENASAYEVVASINANPNLLWKARTLNGGTQVVLVAKADTNESIQVLVPSVGNDANTALGFPADQVDTMLLYLNDRLLFKDGLVPQLTSRAIGLWAPLSSPETLALRVDGTPLSNLVGGLYTFTDQDFVDAATGFTTLGRNTPAAWAKVFNRRISGITATVVNGLIVITSNKGAADASELVLSDCTLTSKGMFSATDVFGAASDYELDRNTGELRLTSPLATNDRLAAGSTQTRAFLESPQFTTINAVADAWWWFVVDGAASIVPTALTGSTILTYSNTSESWGKREKLTGPAGLWTGVKIGDWIVYWDPSSPAARLNKKYRISNVDGAAAWVEYDVASNTTGTQAFTSAGITIVRTDAIPQPIEIDAANNYTASGIAPLLSAGLSGASVATYRTTALRAKTQTFATPLGDIALVAANADAQKFGLPLGNATVSLVGHLASVQSAVQQGTPDFLQSKVDTVAGADPTVTTSGGSYYGTKPASDSLLVGLHDIADTATLTRFGNNYGWVTAIAGSTAVSADWTPAERNPPPFWLPSSRLYYTSPYKLTCRDTLTIVVDQDVQQKRFVVPMWRTLKPVGSTYGTTNTYVDADNGDQSLAVGFGYIDHNPFSFNDFAVFMAARAKTHPQGNSYSSLDSGGAYTVTYSTPHAQPDTSRAVLWRFTRLGPDGNAARVKYDIPSAPNQPVSIAVDNTTSQYTDISVVLASGAQSTGYTIPPSYPIGSVATGTTNGLTSVFYILGYKVLSLSRTSNTVSFQLQLPPGVNHTGLDLTGATQYFFASTTGDLASQSVTLTAESKSNGATPVFDIVSGTITGSNFGPDANAGVLYLAPSTTATLAGATPGVAQGSFVRVEPTAGLSAGFTNVTFRIQNDVVTNPLWIQGVLEGFLPSTSDTVTYAPIGDASLLKIYVNPAQTAGAIVTAVNALAASNSNIPVTGTLLGTGAGKIDRPSGEDAADTSIEWTTLTDGVNFVNVTTPPSTIGGNYQLSFKNGITSGLASGSDWANELVRIVPRTAANVVDWFNSLTVSGLSSVAEVSTADRGQAVQFSSLTPGTGGSVQVQGGEANAATAAVLGSGLLISGTYSGVSIRQADADPFMATGWVAVDNSLTFPNTGIINSGTVLESAVASGIDQFKLTVDNATSFYSITSATSNVVAIFERQGRFVCLSDTGKGTALSNMAIAEGNWIRITTPAAPALSGAIDLINSGNTGIFRVVRVVAAADDVFGNGGSIWLENPAAVYQPLAQCDVQTFSSNSVMPGDQLRVSTALWDGVSSNQGVFEVVTVGDAGSGAFTNAHTLLVKNWGSAVGSATSALGSNYPQVQIIEGTPYRGVKQIFAISPNAADNTLVDLKFTTSAGYERIGAAAGSVVTAFDKLQFTTDLIPGRDGYRYSTGLLAETNKVMYGDASDSVAYPGVVAAGAQLDIEGAPIKRVSISLLIRLKLGANRDEVAQRVKSAAAAVINAADVGVSIPLSDIITAVGKVGGVASVVMINPAATASTDLISVQPYEKPRVLDVDQDILVSFTGQ